MSITASTTGNGCFFSAPLLLLSAILLAGCCNRLPQGPDRPAFDAASSGQQAISLYDKDSNGQISLEEAKACPALAMAFDRVDKNADSALSADEIADRITYFRTADTTIITGATEVKLGNSPLAGATVTFEPESFIGPDFKSCSGVTDDQGVAYVSGHDAKFPGIYLGFYRVRISKEIEGQETVPARYNSESELGYEATDDIPEVNNIIQFHLQQ